MMTVADLTSKSRCDDRHSRLRNGNLLLAVVGAALFLWVILHTGSASIVQQLKALRIALPIVVVLSLGRLIIQTVAWSAALKSEGLEAGMLRLIGIRLASQGMGYLTVFGPVLSEPMKIKLLGSPIASTIGATLLDDGVYWFTSALISIAGCVCICVVKMQGSTSALALSGFLALVVVFIARRKSVLSSVTKRLGKRSPSWLNKVERVERNIREIRAQKPELVRRMFWLDAVCQLLLVLEVAVVFWSLRLPLHLITLVAIEGLTRAIKMMTGWVPARLGADESGAMSAFAAFGLSAPLGLTLALARRARDLSWALVGLAWLLWKSRSANENKIKSETLAKEGTLACNTL